ncbi:MAG TPA: VOC family protein [Candidatus Paceibacterota bacterium]|nr:VOC family protein [Candidatus Paceibacterota bacterium]
MQIQELGHVVLYVSSLERSANFYRDVLGFNEIVRQEGMALFSSGRTHHEMLLIEVGGSPRTTSRAEPGLYHIGFKIGDGPEAAREAHAYLVAQGVRIVGTADHRVTHSIYVMDPDGNELELYADVSNEWEKNPLAVLAPVKSLPL